MANASDNKEPFVKLHKPQFWDLFIRPAFKGVKLQVLAWIAYHSWGERDWEKNENRRTTAAPTCTAKIAQDVGASRWEVSRALAKLRAEGILTKNETGCVGIDKHRLAECAQKRTCAEKRTLSSKSVRKTARACAQKRTPNPGNPLTHQAVTSATDYTDLLQTSGAQRRRAPSHPRFHEFVSWWCASYQARYDCRYLWDGKDGANLRRLLNRLDFDELKARCEYALDHAGKPGHLEWFKPPFSFPQFAQSQVINCCVQTSSTDGYLTADQLFAREENNAHPTSGT